MHWHERPSLGIVLEGEVSKEFSKSSMVVEANNGFTLPAGIIHADHFGPGSRVVMIEIDPQHPASAARLRLCGDVFEHWTLIEDQRIGWLGRRITWELNQPDTASGLAVNGLVGEVLSVAARFGSGASVEPLPDWLAHAREIATSHLNRRVSVTEIADEVGVHPAYLARRFREAFGVTPGAYARNARLDWAAERLANTDLSIAEIAIQAGFSDQSHFTRAFRRYSDQTPAQYRDSFHQNGGTQQ